MEQNEVSAVHWSAVSVEVDAVTLMSALVAEGESGAKCERLANLGPVVQRVKALDGYIRGDSDARTLGDRHHAGA
jgi:hypothetical protein